MAEKINLEIVAPSAILVSEEVDQISAVGTLGEFGVLPGHCQMLTSLKVGEVKFSKSGSVTSLFCSGGYAEIGPEKVTILAEAAELVADIDVDRANRALKKAQDDLNAISTDDLQRKEVESAMGKSNYKNRVS